MKLVNLTPHTIVLRAQDGAETSVEPAGALARVHASPGELGQVDGIAVPVAAADTYGPVEGLPEPTTGVVYLVSALVGARVRDRADVLVPGTGPGDGAVRNDRGHIVAVTRLKRP
jgi:hypothetical protein